MSTGDQLAQATPQNSYKQDFVLYGGGGSGGGGSPVLANTQRFSWFIDLATFDVNLRELIEQNNSFAVWSNSGGTINVPVYYWLTDADDVPASYILANSPLITSQAPPYSFNVTGLPTASALGASGFGELPLQINQQTLFVDYYRDTGAWLWDTFYTYVTNNYSTVQLYAPFIYGNFQLVMPIVPNTNAIQSIVISDIEKYNPGTNPADYADMQVLFTDSSFNTLHSETISRFANPKPGNSSLGAPNISFEYDITASDGKSYWYQLNRYTFEASTPIAVTEGATYYLIVRTASSGTTSNQAYQVDTNFAASGTAINLNLGYYLNGGLQYTTWGGTSLSYYAWDTNHQAAMIFTALRPNPRLCLTAAWASSNYYWSSPNNGGQQITTLKLDTDRRI